MVLGVPPGSALATVRGSAALHYDTMVLHVDDPQEVAAMIRNAKSAAVAAESEIGSYLAGSALAAAAFLGGVGLQAMNRS